MKGEAAAPPIKFCVFESAFLLSESVFPQRNLYDEAILRLLAVAQSGAYSAYVSICDARQTPKEPVRLISFLEALTNSEEILSLKSSTTNQTTVNILLSEDLSSV